MKVRLAITESRCRAFNMQYPDGGRVKLCGERV